MDPVIVPILMGLAFLGLMIFGQSDPVVNAVVDTGVTDTDGVGLIIIWLTVVAAVVTIVTGFFSCRKWLRDKKINVVTIVTEFFRYKK